MFVLLYILLIAAAEATTALVSPVGGVIFHSAILFALIFHSSFASRPPYRKMYLSLGLAPLLRMVSLTMPVSQFSQTYAYLIVSIPMLGAALAASRVLNFQPPEIGLVLKKTPLQALVALTGVLFAWVEYQILVPEPLISQLNVQQILLPALIFLVATGFIEELIFRGVMQSSFTKALGLRGLIYVAVTFSVLQIGTLSGIQVLLAFAVGLVFGFIVKKTGSIVGVSLSHGITNIGLYLVIPFMLS